MRFVVLSRLDAESFRADQPYAVVSFGDPEQPLPLLQDDPRRVGMVRIECHDTDMEHGPWTCFTDADAERVLDFVALMHESAAFIVVHCEAGISRSRGCAVALGRIYGDPFAHAGHGSPNLLIVERLIREHNRRSGQNIPVPVVTHEITRCLVHTQAVIYEAYGEDDTLECRCAVCGERAETRRIEVSRPPVR